MTILRIVAPKPETEDVLDFWLALSEGTLRLMARVPGRGAWTVLRINDKGLKLVGSISRDSFPLPLEDEDGAIKLLK